MLVTAEAQSSNGFVSHSSESDINGNYLIGPIEDLQYELKATYDDYKLSQ